MTHSNFIEIFDDTYQNCIQCQCPVDRVFRNCGVRNSEVLLYLTACLAVDQSNNHMSYNGHNFPVPRKLKKKFHTL